METCSAIQQFTQGSLFCTSPPLCCTRFLCNIENALTGRLFASDFQVNPCSSPPSLSALMEAGGTVLFNQTNISTSQTIPIEYQGRNLGSELNLYVNSTRDSLTLAVSYWPASYCTGFQLKGNCSKWLISNLTILWELHESNVFSYSVYLLCLHKVL